MSEKQLYKVWEHALLLMQTRIKGKNENDKIFLARCWEEAFNVAKKNME